MVTQGFLHGGGEMGDLTRRYDWSKNQLGTPETWPKSLQTTLAILLPSRFPMFLWWGTDLIQFYNDAYRPSLGGSGKHPAALGQKGEDCWPEIWEIIYPLINQVRTTGESTWSEDQLVPIYRDGSIQDVYWTFSYSPVMGEEGTIEGVLVICTETTQKVKYLQELSESKKELEFAIDAADLGTWDLNPVTYRFTSNARLKEWFGLQRDEEIDLAKAIAIMHEDDRKPVYDAIQWALTPTSGGLYDIHYRIVDPVSESQRIVRAMGKAIFDEQNIPVRFNGILQDVTDQKQAELREREAREKIAENERNFRNTILKAPVAICIFKGPSFIVEIANDRMLAIWGTDWPSVADKSIFDGLPEVRAQGFEELLSSVYRTGNSVSIQEYPVQLIRDGKLVQEYISFLYEAASDSQGQITGIIAVAVLVTEQVLARQKIEEIVNARTSELAEANRHLARSNADLRQFAHVASHDLQEPVRKISTYAGLLKTALESEPSLKYLNKIITAADRMKILIRDVLIYSQVSNQDSLFDLVNLEQVVGDLQNEFELLIDQKQATFNFHNLPTIRAIRPQIIQLFGNLFSNALKYSRPEIPVTIAIQAEKKDTEYHIQFSDNGIGFDQQYADQIFQIFQRLHRKTEYSGTGIGLAICKKIVENHGGRIYATGSAGQGASFHIILPFL
jgi:signal transduction histidine kinase